MPSVVSSVWKHRTAAFPPVTNMMNSGVTENPEKFDLNWSGPDNLFGYTSLGYDYYSGYSHAQARDFDSSVGRFINEDTYEGQIGDPQTLNLYTYVENNPLRYTDASAKNLKKGSKLYQAYHDTIWERYGFSSLLDTNHYNYYFGLLTGTSAYKNSAGMASWAREELITAFYESKEAEYHAMLALGMVSHLSGGNPSAKNSSKGAGNSAQIPRTGAEWNDYYKSKYGKGNVTWVTELKSYKDIVSNPKALWGKSANEVGKALGDGWTKGTYGSAGTGWKFTNGDKSVFYHPGDGIHEGSYVGFSSGQTGKVKVVGQDYKPLAGDKAIIIQK